MTKTITISDETYEALKNQIEKLEKPKDVEHYPIATLNDKGRNARLILNLSDSCLADEYKGMLISVTPDGFIWAHELKTIPNGTFYTTGINRQVFPPKE